MKKWLERLGLFLSLISFAAANDVELVRSLTRLQEIPLSSV